MKRTVYADKDEIYSRLMAERDNSLGNIPRSLNQRRREFWRGRAEALEYAAHLIRDWAGEDEPPPGSEDELPPHPACGRCGTRRDVHDDKAAGHPWQWNTPKTGEPSWAWTCSAATPAGRGSGTPHRWCPRSWTLLTPG
jgi:hypothetical protein